MSRFDQRTALVTGGAQGIGLAVTERLAEEGARVVVFDVDAAAAERVARECGARGQTVIACPGDVTRREDVRRAVALCQSDLGGLDLLAAVAGTASGGPLLEIEDASWQRVLDVNLGGVFHSIQEAGRAMAAAGGGAMAIVASTNAFWVESDMAPYNASKGGVVALAQSAAIDLAAHGIRVNVVAPGVVKTRLSVFLTEDPEQSKEYLARVPLGRFATTQDVAKSVAFLLSDDSDYVTGHTLVLDGGSTVGIRLSVPDTAFPGFDDAEVTA